LAPMVTAIFDFNHALDAIAIVEDGHADGKVVVLG